VSGGASSGVKNRKIHGPIGWAISAILLTVKLAIWLYIGVLISILVEWVGMAFFYPEQGAMHSEDMVRTEVAYLSEDFRDTPVVKDSLVLANTITTYVKNYSVLYFGFESITVDLKKRGPVIEAARAKGIKASDVAPRSSVFFYSLRDYVHAALNITIVYCLRLTILVLALPLFLMAITWAIVKGLNKRDLRRWGVDHESAFVYSWAKGMNLPFLIAPFVIYLALPFSLHPSYILLPFAAAEAFILMMTVASFKKYL